MDQDNLAKEIIEDIDKMNERIRRACEETNLSIDLSIIIATSMLARFPVIQPNISKNVTGKPLPNTKCEIDTHFGFYLASKKDEDGRLR